MIKLIVTDIDGTLTKDGNTYLNPEYFDVIRKLREKGIHVAVASGRHAVSVRKTFAPVLDQIWILSQNGSVIEYDGACEVLKPVPTEWVKAFWQDLKQYPEVESLIDTADETFCPFAGTYMHQLVRDEYQFNVSPVDGWDAVPENEIYSMMTIYHPESSEDFLNSTDLRERWQDKIDIVVTGQIWADCLLKGIDKGYALTRLREKLGIDQSECIAFGDNNNDIPLLRAAGIGYAVDNAREEVKEAADRVIPGYREDGVLQVWKQILECNE